MKDEIDRVLNDFGKYGKWQFFIFTITSWWFVVQAWHVFAITFQGAQPADFHCATPEDINLTEAIPEDDDNGCRQYVNFSSLTGKTIPCTEGYVYDDSNGKTIVTEWDLVCDRSIYVELSSTMFFAGKLVGALVISTISDLIGRKKTMIGANILLLVVGVLQIFSPGYIMYALMRFFTAVFQTGAELAGYCLMCESIPIDSRAWALVLTALFWSLGIMLMPLVALPFHNWRHLQIAITIPMTVIFVYFWIMPESVHWLVSRNRVREAEEILQKAGRMNRIHIPQKCLSGCPTITQEKAKLQEPKKQTLINIYRTPTLRIYSTVLLLIWAVNALVYYGLTLGVGELTGSLHLNLFLSGAVELPAYFLAQICAERFGRIKSLSGFHLVCGVALACLLVIPKETKGGADTSWISTTVVTLGKAANSASFMGLYLYTAEIYPTVVRNSGIGMSSSVARVGSMIAPLTITLQRKFNWLQPVLFGSLAFFAGFAIIFFPETKGKVLPENLVDWLYWKEHGQLNTRERHMDTNINGQIVASSTKPVSSATAEVWL